MKQQKGGHGREIRLCLHSAAPLLVTWLRHIATAGYRGLVSRSLNRKREKRERKRRLMDNHGKLNEIDNLEIEPLSDEALEAVAGGKSSCGPQCCSCSNCSGSQPPPPPDPSIDPNSVASS